jgi:hypothetical protein
MSYINDDGLRLATINIANLPTGGVIGAATTTVDVASSFNISQTTAGQVLTLPNPTNIDSGRVVFITNSGTAGFTIAGNLVNSGNTVTGLWTGSTWSFTLFDLPSSIVTVSTNSGAPGGVIPANFSGYFSIDGNFSPTVTLPSAAGRINQIVHVRNGATFSFALQATNKIPASNRTLASGVTVFLVSNGVNWVEIN